MLSVATNYTSQTPLSFVTSLYALDYFKPANDDDLDHVSGWGQNDIGKALGTGYL
jgi:hypothetical protein